MARIDDPRIWAGLQGIRRAMAGRVNLFDLHLDARQRERDAIWAPLLQRSRDRREQGRVYERWAVSWGTASVGFFETEERAIDYARQLHGNGETVRAITRTVEVGGRQETQVLRFDPDQPKAIAAPSGKRWWE